MQILNYITSEWDLQSHVLCMCCTFVVSQTGNKKHDKFVRLDRCPLPWQQNPFPCTNIYNAYTHTTAGYTYCPHTASSFVYHVVKMTNARSALGLTCTDYSCISWMGAGTPKVIGSTAALGQIQLCPSTKNTVLPFWITTNLESHLSIIVITTYILCK